jgi:hypothetical protein
MQEPWKIFKNGSKTVAGNGRSIEHLPTECRATFFAALHFDNMGGKVNGTRSDN